MKNTIKAGVGLSALAISNVAMAANMFDKNSGGVEATIWTSKKSFDQLVLDWISYISGFLYLIAVVIGLWWAFNILTAAGDEDKVKKGKDIIVRAILWLIAVFAVSVIMRFVISALFTNI